MILRSEKNSTLSQVIQLFTSILSFGLYTYSTAILAGMAMFPASDALRCMVLFTISAGIGRSIVSRVIARRGRWKSNIVFDINGKGGAKLKDEVEVALKANRNDGL